MLCGRWLCKRHLLALATLVAAASSSIYLWPPKPLPQQPQPPHPRAFSPPSLPLSELPLLRASPLLPLSKTQSPSQAESEVDATKVAAVGDAGDDDDFALPHVLSFGESPQSLRGARAAARAGTARDERCSDEPDFFFDVLQTAVPRSELRFCNALELAAAFGRASRASPDAPLVVPGDCAVYFFQGRFACDVVAAAGGLDLYGDSLTRHLIQALREATTGNFSSGLYAHMSGPYAADGACACIGAFDDGHLRRFPGDQNSQSNTFCRENSAAYASLPELRVAWPNLCSSWPPDEDYISSYSRIPHFEGGSRPSRGGIVVLQGGLHFPSLDSTVAQTVYGWRQIGARRHVLMNAHAPGPNKPVAYIEGFGDEPTRAYNKIIASIAEADPHALLLDAYAVTIGQPSVDGQHYGHKVNAVLAQILFNLVHAVVQEDSKLAVLLSSTADATSTKSPSLPRPSSHPCPVGIPQEGAWQPMPFSSLRLEPVCCTWDVSDVGAGANASICDLSIRGGMWTGNAEKLVPAGGHACNCESRAHALSSWEWTPSKCTLGEWDASAFCAALDGRRLLFIGDSTSQQVAAAVHNYVLVGGGGCSALIASAESDTLTGRPEGGADRGTPSWVDALRAAKQRPDIVVLGVGPHIFTGETGFRSVLQLVRDELENPEFASLQVLWRTASGGGCLVAGENLVPRKVWPRDEPGYWETLASNQRLYNYNELERWDLVAADFWRNQPRVNLFDLTPLWLRPDNMVDSGSAAPKDCVHSCMPGALRLAARQLLHLLRFAIPNAQRL